MFVYGILIALLAGLGMMFFARTGVLDNTMGRELRITWIEYLIGAAICCLIVVPFTVIVGNKVALANNLTYHEYWSGYETAALKSETTCERDGSCQFTYNCDPYEVTIHHSATYDSKGNQTSPAYDTYETRYHSCPQATVEWDFAINTTLGQFHIERTFADNPQPYRGESDLGVARHGAPPFWQDALDHLNASDPRPVTVRKDYDNYILASQSSILHKFSAQVDQYKSVIPAPVSDVHDLYLADKAYFIGTPALPGWQESVMRFNAAFGDDLQGDLHVVVVGDQVTNSPDEFTGALNAYWTGTSFGRNAISKNTLVVVIGTDGQKATWVRAFTGMPRGNEALLLDIQRELTGKPMDPDVILGHPKGQLTDGKIAGVTHGTGALEAQVWGVDQFARVSMHKSYTYLESEIRPTSGQRITILSIATFISLIVWALFIIIGTNRESHDVAY